MIFTKRKQNNSSPDVEREEIVETGMVTDALSSAKQILAEQKKVAETAVVADTPASILNDLSIEKAIKKSNNAAYFKLGEEAGFRQLEKRGLGYAFISEGAISKCLKERLKKSSSYSQFNNTVDGSGMVALDTSNDKNYCQAYSITVWNQSAVWREQAVEKYTGTPPLHVLKSAKEAKLNGLNDLRVVTVSVEEVPLRDPLLIARQDNLILLIDWWDKDFTADEILALTDIK